MTVFLVSLSIASVLTAIFAFRFGTFNEPKVLAAYFTLFFVLELVAEAYFIPPGVYSIEVAYVCFFLTGLFVVANVMRAKLDAREDRPEG